MKKYGKEWRKLYKINDNMQETSYYIEVLCNLVEDTTWYSRKNTDQMLIKIFNEFDNAQGC